MGIRRSQIYRSNQIQDQIEPSRCLHVLVCIRHLQSSLVSHPGKQQSVQIRPAGWHLWNPTEKMVVMLPSRCRVLSANRLPAIPQPQTMSKRCQCPA